MEWLNTGIKNIEYGKWNIHGGIDMDKAKSFQDLLVWKKAHQFVLSVYKFTTILPRSEQYGLISQFRRAAISVPANIAEGFKKRGKTDKARFMNIAQGSLEESSYYLILIRVLGYGSIDEHLANLNEISKLLENYRNKILKSRY